MDLDQDLPIKMAIEFAMFGTYRTTPTVMEIKDNAIRLCKVATSDTQNKQHYHINIPFSEVIQVVYCLKRSSRTLVRQMVAIKVCMDSCRQIAKCLSLSLTTNGLILDTFSLNFKEKFIIIVFKEEISESILTAFISLAEKCNPHIDCHSIGPNLAALMIDKACIDQSCRLAKTMSRAFDNPEICDLKLKVKHKQSDDRFGTIHVHKWLLIQNLEYFGRMFANDWKENESNEIEIKGYSFEAYYEFIRYHYTNCIVTKDIDTLLEMLSIGKEYLYTEFKAECEEILKHLVDEKSICYVFSVAVNLNEKDLEDFCFNKIVDIFGTIGSQRIKEMDSDIAKRLLVRLFELPDLYNRVE